MGAKGRETRKKRNEEIICDIHRDVTKYSFSFLFIGKVDQIKMY